MSMELAIHWFRRDLRLEDNRALDHALRSGLPVQCIFIFDSNILDQLEDKDDARVHFLYDRILELNHQLQQRGSYLRVYSGSPDRVWQEVIKEFKVKAVFASHDYESYGKRRDTMVLEFLSSHGVSFQTCKDCVIFEKDEVVKDDGKPYTVFTPYSRKWKSILQESDLLECTEGLRHGHFHQSEAKSILHLADLGFAKSSIEIPKSTVSDSLIKSYTERRNFPAVAGTSKLGVHLRFGTISLRALAMKALPLNETFFNELIWRDFYHQVLHHFPHVEQHAFKPAYERIQWVNDENMFEKWCKGETGYPLVDAGMRELMHTGFMHNRVRMVVSSFLCKHLLIDYKWGEAWFAKKLLDFELSSNNGGWQWSAGCGTDAAPYFRIFNPHEQLRKFDPQMQYVAKWAPEHLGLNPPKPLIEHTFARDRCLEVYKNALENKA